MKQLITFLFVLFALNVKAQVDFDTTVKNYAVCKINTPFKAVWNDTSKAYYLHVNIAGDNLKDAAILNWVFFSKALKPLANGSVVVDSLDYQNWNGNNLFPFIHTATKLNITLK
jgi:hypothetical protein